MFCKIETLFFASEKILSKKWIHLIMSFRVEQAKTSNREIKVINRNVERTGRPGNASLANCAQFAIRADVTRCKSAM